MLDVHFHINLHALRAQQCMMRYPFTVAGSQFTVFHRVTRSFLTGTIRTKFPVSISRFQPSVNSRHKDSLDPEAHFTYTHLLSFPRRSVGTRKLEIRNSKLDNRSERLRIFYEFLLSSFKFLSFPGSAWECVLRGSASVFGYIQT